MSHFLVARGHRFASLHALGAAVVMLIMTGCSLDGSSTSVRYSLDVVLQLPERDVTASSVYELTMSSGGGDNDESGMAARIVTQFKGQAIVVPLTNRPTLVVLMTTVGAEGFRRLFLESCGLQIGDNESARRYLDRVAAFQGPCDVDTSSLKIVGIKNPKDPLTLLPFTGSNLAATFGPGVRLKSARVRRTEAPVTSGIRDLFPWVLAFGEVAPPDYALYRVHIGVDITSNLFLLGDI